MFDLSTEREETRLLLSLAATGLERSCFWLFLHLRAAPRDRLYGRQWHKGQLNCQHTIPIQWGGRVCPSIHCGFPNNPSDSDKASLAYPSFRRTNVASFPPAFLASMRVYVLPRLAVWVVVPVSMDSEETLSRTHHKIHRPLFASAAPLAQRQTCTQGLAVAGGSCNRSDTVHNGCVVSIPSFDGILRVSGSAVLHARSWWTNYTLGTTRIKSTHTSATSWSQSTRTDLWISTDGRLVRTLLRTCRASWVGYIFTV
jgi:hypothetical protein